MPNAIITGDADGDVTEAGGIANGTAGDQTDTGDLDHTDVDNDDDVWQVVAAGETSDNGYGSYELTAAGVWIYTLDDSNATVQALNGAATLTDKFTALTEDGTPQLVTITINAQNDAATITGDATGSVTEAGGTANGTPGDATDTGNLNSTDPDNTDDAWQAVGTTATGYGSYEIGSDGVWIYTLDDSDPDIQALNGLATETDNFIAVTEDGTSKLVTITIHAQNDAPTQTNLFGDTAVWAESDSPQTLDLGANASLTDVDSPNFDTGTLTVSITGGKVAAEDVLGVQDDAAVTVLAGNKIDVNGTEIATYTGGGAGGGDLVFTFDPDATPARVAQLIQAVTFVGGGFDDPTDGDRTITWTLVDGDGAGGTLSGTTTVDVDPVNDAPVGTNNTVSGTEDDPYTFEVADFPFTDAEGDDLLSVTITTLPAVGTLLLDGVAVTAGDVIQASDITADKLTFQPVIDKNGSPYTSFTFQVQDDGGTDDGGADLDTSADTLTINITPNIPPTAKDDTLGATEDTPVTYPASAILGNDTDPDGGPLVIDSVSGFTNGTAVLNGDGSVTFTPASEFSGVAGFDYVVSDGKGGTDTGHVTVNVAEGLPVANDDVVNTPEDQVLTLPAASLIANDSDGDGDPLTLTGVSGATNGKVVLNGGKVTFTPDANFSGVAGFDYTITDGSTSDTGHVTVNVTPVNDPPTAPATNAVTTMEDTASAAIAIGASDIDGGPLTYTVRSFDQPARGTVSFSGGTFIYTPFADENGSDSFVITIDDGNFSFANQTVAVTITPVNDPPVAVDDSRNADQDTTAEYSAAGLLANDSDVDGDALRITAVSNPQNGTVSLPASRVVFTPTPGFVGTAGFDYTITDDKGGTDTGHVTITVGPAEETNADPQLDPVPELTTLEDTALLLTVKASDADGDPLTYAAIDPANGTLTQGADGNFTYTPDEGFTGTDSFTVTVTDGEGGSAQRSVEIAVVELPAADDWRLIASDGFDGEIGGSGQVIGTQGFQRIAVLDLPGTIAFDPSTNQGGDVIALDGDADSWRVVLLGSSALFSDGDTFVAVPAGIEETHILFADGVLELRFDEDEGAIMLGEQEVSETLTPIAQAPDGSPPADNSDPEALARLYIAEDGSVAAGGRIDMIGTNGAEQARVTRGDVTLDPSFNEGNDSLTLDAEAETFTAMQLGSSVLLDGAAADVLIPVGTAGMTIAFADGERELRYDPDLDLEAILLGTQTIGLTPVPLADFA